MPYLIIKRLAVAVQLYLIFFMVHLLIASTFKKFTLLNPQLHYFNYSVWLEPLFLLLVFLVLLLLSFRLIMSLILTCLMYISLLFANTGKASTLQIPVYPSDVYSIKELFLLEQAFSYLWPLLVLTVIFFGVIVTALKTDKPQANLKKHWKFNYSMLLLVTLIIGFFRPEISNFATKNKVWSVSVNMLNTAERLGFLTFFCRRIIDFKKPSPPDGYSKDKIIDLALKYKSNRPNEIRAHDPNVIIFLIESFNDPNLTALKTSYDPIPNFRKHAQNNLSGNILVPVIGGLSANSEFELLTGLSMRFVPEDSIPYINAINQPIPSIARTYKEIGYETSAIHVASMKFFNYQKVYPLLGFDHAITLKNHKDLTKDPANRYINEKSLVQEIIKRTNKDKPQFIFSFPNSTHGNWDYDAYLESDLVTLNGSFLTKKKQLKTYINALYAADQAIGELIDHYQASDEATVILIAGDHLPGLKSYNFMKVVKDFNAEELDFEAALKSQSLGNLFRDFQSLDTEKFHVSTHRTPYLLWSNYAPTTKSQNTSINLIHSQIFDLTGSTRSPLYNLTKILHQEIQEVSLVIKASELKHQFSVPKHFAHLINDYELFQYDILYGDNHYMQWLESTDQP